MDAVAALFRNRVCGATTILESCEFHLFPVLMKQFLKRIIIFCAYCTISCVILGVSASQSPRLEFRLFGNSASGGHTWWRMKEFKMSSKNIDYSILHLGSSTTYRSINPNIFQSKNYETFNLGSPAQTISNSLSLLKWALKYEPTITTITLDIYPRLWPIKPTESSRDMFVNNPHVGDFQFQLMAWQSSDLYNKILALYFGLKYTFLSDFELSKSDIDSYEGRGFTFSNKPPVTSFSCDSIEYKLCPTNENALFSIIEICQSQKLDLIISFPPHLCDHNATLPESLRDITFIDGNQWPLAKNDTLYFDEHHLRGVGAKLYSIWFADQILAYVN